MDNREQLIFCNTIEDSKCYLQQFLNFFFLTIEKSTQYQPQSEAEADCLMLVQMMFARVNSFCKLLDGFDFHLDNVHLNRIIDPITIFSITRNIYEALCSFELVFVLPKTDDEKTIVYNTFVAAGLKERQGFSMNTDAAEALKGKELQEWKEAEDAIHNTQVYQKLTDKNKKNFDKIFNSTHPVYRWHIDETGMLKVVNWEEAYKLIGLREGTFGSLYSFLSLHTHPTSVSLRQFRESFLKQEPAFVWLVCFACKIVSVLLSVYIADLGHNFDFVKRLFDEQEEHIQWMLDVQNKVFRGYSYVLSDFWKKAGTKGSIEVNGSV